MMVKRSQLTLTWNSHNTIIRESLQHLHQKEIFCDATLVCHGKYFPAHKFILSTYSSYFEEVLEMMPCKHPFIIIKDVPEEELQALLEFMYNGVVNVYEDQITSLLKVAETFQIKGLTFPEEYSTANINSDLEEQSPVKKRRTKMPGRKRKAPTPKRSKGVKQLKIDNVDTIEEDYPELSTCSKMAQENDDQKETFPDKEEKLIEFSDSNPNSFSFPQIIEEENEDNVDSFDCVGGADIKIENEVMEEEMYYNIPKPNDVWDVSLPQNSESNSMENDVAIQPEDDMPYPYIFKNKELMMPGEESDHSFDESQNEVTDPDWNQKGRKLSTRCSICSYQGKSRIDLQNHKKAHREDKPYKCSLCPYSTAHNYNLKVHFRIHTGEKPFQCTICSYSTIQRSNLDKHVRIHTGEKPYKCPLCPYSGVQKSSLNKHMETHNENQQ